MSASGGAGGVDDADTQALLAYLRDCATDAARHQPFALLRQAEARAPHLPRIGRARLPAHNVVDVAQAPNLAFPSATLASIDVDGPQRRSRVRGYYLGLTGPMGPLPLHITEVAYDEERHATTRPFGRFLDVLAGRMLQLFYRAWGDSQPAVHADRPQDDRFAGYVAALSGAAEGGTSTFPAAARLGFAALFVGRRSVGAIEDGLRHLLGSEVEVHPFEPRWRAIEPEDRTTLHRGGGFAVLGRDAVAGGRVRQVADAFRVRLRVSSYREYQALLPSGSSFALAADAIDAFAPSHLDWVIELGLAADKVPPARLNGGSALGWSSWLPSRSPAGGHRVDARLRRRARTDLKGVEAS